MSDEDYLQELTDRENHIEKLYIDGVIDEHVYSFQIRNIKLARQYKQQEIMEIT